MRLIGMVLALGAIAWVFLRAAPEGDPSASTPTAMPQGYQQSLEKAEGLEQALQDAADARINAIEGRDP